MSDGATPARFKISKMPDWLLILLDFTGGTTIMAKVKAERDRRESEDFVHPLPNLYALVSDMRFELVFGMLIVVNCFAIGAEASELNGRNSDVYWYYEFMFTLCFFVEWLLRLGSFGLVWLTYWPNMADSFIVLQGVLTMWIMPLVGMEKVVWLRKLTVLRCLRLIRLARTVRMFPSFKEMWLLLRGLIESFRTLVWTLVIILTVLYVFAIVSVDLIGGDPVWKEDAELHAYVQERFALLHNSMFTLFQVMTLDTWGDSVVRPLMAKVQWTSYFFIFFMMVSVCVLMNLITAVIVENAFSIVMEDEELKAKVKEAETHKEIQSLARMFKELDEDGSGELSYKEFQKAIRMPKFLTKLALIGLKKDEAEEVWGLLDDGDGSLTVNEFTNGLRRMVSGPKAKDILDMLKKLKVSVQDTETLEQHVWYLDQALIDLQEDVDELSSDLGLVAEVAKVLMEACGPKREVQAQKS